MEDIQVGEWIEILEVYLNAQNRKFVSPHRYKFLTAIEHLIKEYKKKDKIIEAMAEQLTSPIHNKEEVIEYFTKEVEREVE